MIEIKVTEDTALPMITGAKEQMPFAVAQALTWVAEDTKFAMAKNVGETLTIRDPWVKSPQRWKVTRARKDDYPNSKAIVELDHEAGFLADHERGGVRVMRRNPLAIPTRTLRPAFGQLVPRNLLPHNIGINTFRTPDGREILAGRGPKSRKSAKAAAKKYFRMRPKMLDAPAAGAWERFGSGAGLPRGSDRIRYLWKLVSMVRIPKRLHTIDAARAEVMKQWPDKIMRSFSIAMATARRPRGQ